MHIQQKSKRRKKDTIDGMLHEIPNSCLRPLETTEDLVAEIQNFLYNHESKNQIFSLELKLYVS